MNGIAFFFALVFFIGGLALFGYAFEFTGFELPTFAAGIAAIVVSMAIPFHVMRRTDR